MIVVDIKDFTNGEILIEKDFQLKVEEHAWSSYADKKVLVRGCSDIIIPPWAYMVIAGKLAGHADKIRFGNEHSNIVVYRKPKVTS